MLKHTIFLTFIIFAFIITGCSSTSQSNQSVSKWTEWRPTYDKNSNITKIQYSLTKYWNTLNNWNDEYLSLYNGYDKPYDIRCKIYFTRKSPIELTIYAYINKASEPYLLQYGINEYDVEKIVILDLVEK
jgi:hypothetical protein